MLTQGRIVLEKPLDVLLNEHITPIYDVDIPRLDPQIHEALAAVKGVTHVSIDHDHMAVTVTNADACAPRLLAFFAEKGLPIRSFALRKSSLEDIFIREANGNER
jgi:ABC-2 type transport system ATP-binding protein